MKEATMKPWWETSTRELSLCARTFYDATGCEELCTVTIDMMGRWFAAQTPEDQQKIREAMGLESTPKPPPVSVGPECYGNLEHYRVLDDLARRVTKLEKAQQTP